MSANKARGTRWESAIVTFLQGCGWRHVERRALSGAKDRGDIAGIPGVVIEGKSAAAFRLSEWLDEATTERDNDHADIGVVWFKRPRKSSPGAGFVLMDGYTFVRLLADAGYR